MCLPASYAQCCQLSYLVSRSIYLKTQSEKVKTSTDCFTSADHQEISKLGFTVSLVVNN